MNESTAAAAVTKPQLANYYRWVEPDSDITVFLKLETVDRLQLEVLRGVYSFSGAGNEVGGILLGRTDFDKGRILLFVDDFETVPCEHRNGPFYALTGKDGDNFKAAVAPDGTRRTLSVVGYYRSHNRDGLFLSADDLRLIQRHFRGPGNLFLLIKTMPNRACTAGFFFWKDGHVRCEFTGSEAPLIPIALSSARRSLSLREAVEDMPTPSQAIVLPGREERPEIAPREAGRSRYPRRLLIRGLVITGVTAAVTFAVLLYREKGPAQDQAPGAPQPVSVAVAKGAPAVPTPVITPAPVAKQSAPIILSPAKTVLPRVGNKPSRPLRLEPELRIRAPVREKQPVLSTAANEPGTPESRPLTVMAERPVNTAPQSPAGTTAAPPVPAPSPPATENPVTPVIQAPRPDASASVVAPVSTSAPPTPPPSPAAHTFVGPLMIHQVTPAVPLGVGPMIATDVQVDVAVAIDANGKVTGARVASTKGAAAGLLTIEALKAAQLFRFRPARENGRDVASSMVLTFRFARRAK